MLKFLNISHLMQISIPSIFLSGISFLSIFFPGFAEVLVGRFTFRKLNNFRIFQKTTVSFVPFGKSGRRGGPSLTSSALVPGSSEPGSCPGQRLGQDT